MEGKEIKGCQFGVRLSRRGKDDPHISLQLLGEDDENWFEIGNGFSSFWIDDLIQVLEDTKTIIKKRGVKEEHGFGYRFKSGKETL